MAKTYKNLYPQIYDFENLLQAYHRARKGKKQTPEMYAFHFNLEENLWDLHRELQAGTYQPGSYRNFYIHDPKRRKISAAPFQDRVVHHALCRVIEPLFERKFIDERIQPISPVGGNPGQRYPAPVPAGRLVPRAGAGHIRIAEGAKGQ